MTAVYARVWREISLADHRGFKIGFEVNVMVVFADNYVVAEKIPVTIFRHSHAAKA